MNSMTGFGAACVPFRGASLRVEISGINRKQLECVINLPRPWAELEPLIRDFTTRRVSRGRVNIGVTPEAARNGKDSLRLDEGKLASLHERLQQIEKTTGIAPQVTVDALLRLGILSDAVEDSTAPERVWTEFLLPALQQAFDQFLQMRREEGEHLCTDLLARVNTLCVLREKMLKLAAQVPLHYREALMRRLKEQGLTPEEPDERLVKELALFADKCDVSEEMTRLDSHLRQFEKICRSADVGGRPLDFLCQEIFRELNTTGSKANSAELAQLVVTAKTELEKIREQVQNVE